MIDMATIATTTNRALVNDLVQQVLNGQALDAFETFYADHVKMQENAAPPTVGKAANREREKQFFGSIAEFHRGEAPTVLVEGDQAVIHWVMEFTNTSGQRVVLDQLALQTWSDGQIVGERFFYNAGGTQ